MSNLYKTASQTYRLNQISNASPLDLLIMAYDAALIGCSQGDLERTSKALSVLRNALDYSYDPQVAGGFLRLYLYCGDLARKGEYDEAAHILRELRDSWVQVKANLEPRPLVAQYPSANVQTTPGSSQKPAATLSQVAVAV